MPRELGLFGFKRRLKEKLVFASLRAVNHYRFNYSLSSTFSGIGETYTLRYGFGDLSVVLGYDTVTVSDF